MRFIEGPRAPSDRRKCRELFVPVENQGSQPSTPKITHSIPRRLAKRATQTIPLVFISSADPGPAWN
jgi:hypothetical protein